MNINYRRFDLFLLDYSQCDKYKAVEYI